MTPRPLDTDRIWADQAEFNRLFRPADPATFEERSALTREMALHLVAQTVQLLEATDWRTHRNNHVRENRAQVGNQLIDIHKYWITLCQAWGFSHEDMMDLYWKKSMVCRQRHAEEWVRRIDRPTVFLDLDNVLCDYILGFGTWLQRNTLLTPEQRARLDGLIDRRLWLDAESTRIDPLIYQQLKHRFRVSGVKALLPPMPGAKAFVDWCRTMGWQIGILTSRPIAEYPNLYSDTLEWLDTHGMAADFVWWGNDKGEKLVTKEVLPFIEFVVDDDLTYVNQYADLGVRTYWLTNRNERPLVPYSSVYVANTFHTIQEAEHVRRQGTPPAR